jgi:hypothetical protein
MAKFTSSFCAIAISLFVLLQAGFAQAQSARTWVSGAGADTGGCTRAAPCATFAFAYAATSAGGEIDVLTGGDFGPLTIQHALTIADDGAGTGGIIPPNLNVNIVPNTPTNSGNAISIQAGSTDAVVLRGLSLNGATNGPDTGIAFTSGGSLLIDHCKIQGFQSGPGIAFAPSSAAKLWVTHTVLSNDGVSIYGSIWVAPVSGATTTAHFERVQVLQAIGNGIRVDGTQGGGALDVDLHDMTVDGASSSGIVAVSQTSGGPAVNVVADDVTSSHNNGFGLRAVGGTASIALSRSTVTNNVRGIGASSGGALVSYGDNRIKDNTNGDGDPTSTLPLK